MCRSLRRRVAVRVNKVTPHTPQFPAPQSPPAWPNGCGTLGLIHRPKFGQLRLCPVNRRLNGMRVVAVIDAPDFSSEGTPEPTAAAKALNESAMAAPTPLACGRRPVEYY